MANVRHALEKKRRAGARIKSRERETESKNPGRQAWLDPKEHGNDLFYIID